mmetsp:Transcript_1628/g.2904  ORF Transcript_1628/g.2904 Transcript_1628/m.2904 type:complete len:334 (+) Transcript_1628:2-1003(+)
MGESGDSHRLAQPEVRTNFRDFILGRAREMLHAGTPCWEESGFRYASLGSGELLFDLELLERIRGLGVRIAQICLIDFEYREPGIGTQRALRAFADWQRAAAQLARDEAAEIFAFGRLKDYYEAAGNGGPAAGCHLLVHCDAFWNGAFEDCERLATRALATGGMLARLSNQEEGQQLRRCICLSEQPFEADLEQEEDVRRSRPTGNQPYFIAAWERASSGFLEPVQAPVLSKSSISRTRQLAATLGLTVWRVVHKPRIAVRAKPDAKSEVVGVLYAGDEVIMAGEQHGDWMRVSEATQLADEPDEAWVLVDGSSVGLGALLEFLPVPDEPSAK